MDVLTVGLFDPFKHKQLSIVLDGSLSRGDIRDLIEQSFGVGPDTVVGLWSVDIKTLFPLSILSHTPFCFESGARFELVRKQEEYLSINCSDGSQTEESSCLSSRSPRYQVDDVTTLTLSEAIDEARHLLGNDDIDIESFVNIANGFANSDNNKSVLNRSQLHTCFRLFQQRIEPYQYSAEYKERQTKFIDLIFDSLKLDTFPNTEEIVVVRDVLSMLSVLTVDQLHKNYGVLFSVYDAEQVGYIDEHLFLSHLYVVFGFLSNLSRHVREYISTYSECDGDTHKFARLVWMRLLEEDSSLAAKIDDENILFESNFVSACESVLNSGYGGVLFDRPTFSSEEQSFHALFNVDINTAGTLTQRRYILGLSKYSASFVLDLFAESASEEGLLSFAQYHRVLAKLIERHYNYIVSIEKTTADLIIWSIFQLFDPKASGFCDVQDLASALIIYCGGNSKEKARALFSLLYRYKSSPNSRRSNSQSREDQDEEQEDIDSRYNVKTLSLNRLSNSLSSIFKAATLLDADEDSEEANNGTGGQSALMLQESTYDTVAAEISLSALSNCGVRLDDYRSVYAPELPKYISQFAFEKCLCDTFTQYFGDSLDAVEADSPSMISPEKGLQPIDDDDEDRDDYRYNNANDRRSYQSYQNSCNINDEEEDEDEEDDNDEEYGYDDSEDDEGRDSEDDNSNLIRIHPLSNSTSNTNSSNTFNRNRNTSNYNNPFYEPLSPNASNELTNNINNSRDIERGSNLDNSDVVKELRMVQSMLGMTVFPAEDLIETMGDYAFGGIISKEGFIHTLSLIARLHGIHSNKQLQEVSAIAEQIFGLFEIDHNTTNSLKKGERETASYFEITAGLTCLCDSSFEDKLLVSFTMLDNDGDNQLTIDEFTALLVSYLRVIYVCSETAADKIDKSGLALSEIASAVACEAVKSLGYYELDYLTFDMILQIADDCMDLAENVATLAHEDS